MVGGVFLNEGPLKLNALYFKVQSKILPPIGKLRTGVWVLWPHIFVISEHFIVADHFRIFYS